jgi:hypothetical protein
MLPATRLELQHCDDEQGTEVDIHLALGPMLK